MDQKLEAKCSAPACIGIEVIMNITDKFWKSFLTIFFNITSIRRL